MPPKNKSEKRRYRKKLGPWYRAGQIIIILGAILIIVAAILDIISYYTGSGTVDWSSSYTIGQIGIPILTVVIAIVLAAVILWMALDRRFVDSVNLVVVAIIFIVLAIIVGNVGALIVIIGAILLIFEHFAHV
jgi:hypothetical protein